jgi:hypothetical protein
MEGHRGIGACPSMALTAHWRRTRPKKNTSHHSVVAIAGEGAFVPVTGEDSTHRRRSMGYQLGGFAFESKEEK